MTLETLYPEVVKVFEATGWKPRLSYTRGMLIVSLSKGVEVHSKSFPYPLNTEDLLIPLRVWNEELEVLL